MSDAACAECGKMVGYVFHGAADEHQNGNHVGRAGLVRHPIATPSVPQPLRDVSIVTSKCWLQVLSCITFGDALGRAERQDPAPSRTMTPPQVPAQG